MQVRELELDLDAFEGPFDLLLTLVLREELRPRDVDIADIVVAFLERLASRPSPATASAGRSPASPPPDAAGRQEASPSSRVRTSMYCPRPRSWGSPPLPAAPEEREARGELDLEACGEFLVLVGALLELKARELFPEEAAELADLDPEEAAEELTRRLEEYRRMKEAAGWLWERLGEEEDRFFRLGPAPLAPRPEPRIAPQPPEALAEALRALAVEPPDVSLAHMGLRFPPVTQFLDRFRAVLRRRRRFDFEQEVTGLSRVEQAVAFLALLELRKADEIRIEQAAPFAPIRVARPGPEGLSRPDEEGETPWTARSA